MVILDWARFSRVHFFILFYLYGGILVLLTYFIVFILYHAFALGLEIKAVAWYGMACIIMFLVLRYKIPYYIISDHVSTQASTNRLLKAGFRFLADFSNSFRKKKKGYKRSMAMPS